LSEGDPYDQLLLRKDMERLKEYFKKRNYYRPVIGPYFFNGSTLVMTVNPGKRLDISVEGNYAISTKDLLKEMPFFEAEDFGDDIIQETVHRILSVYHTKGYPFAQVAPVATEQDHDIQLTFFIFEGAEVEISSISFQGNTLEEENLKEVLSLKEGEPYNPDSIYADQELLQEYYRAVGYLSANVDEFQTHFNEASQAMEIIINIHEGMKTVLEHIEIEGADLVSKEDVLKVIKLNRGDAYNEVDISDARLRILELYNTRGFPDVYVAVSREIDGQEASLVFEIQEGDRLFFGRTIISGNNKTRYRVIQRELQNKEGQPYNYALLSRERQKLYKLGLFSDIDIEILDRYDHTQDILMKMQEGNAGSVEFGIGYADYERLRGSFDVGYRNLWGMNRQASLRLELSTLENRIITQFYEPWFLERPIPFRAFLLYEKRKEINIDTRDTRYRLKRISASAGFEKKFTKHLKAELYYEFSVVKTYDVQPDVVLTKEDRGTLIISGIRPGIVYDTRDNPFYPKKGILTGVSTKITSPLLLSETDFVKASFYLNMYKEIMKRVVLATSFRGGLAKGYNDTDELPLVERFFLGGRNTVRGYDQDELGPKGSDGDPTGGNAFLMQNLELRFSLWRGLGLVAFLDGGNVWIEVEDIDLSDFKFTTGLGLRYNTPVGPVRIDYGYKLDKERGESSGEVHFSIGHAF
jgi:outer membrane protein insertion porin family